VAMFVYLQTFSVSIRGVLGPHSGHIAKDGGNSLGHLSSVPQCAFRRPPRTRHIRQSGGRRLSLREISTSNDLERPHIEPQSLQFIHCVHGLVLSRWFNLTKFDASTIWGIDSEKNSKVSIVRRLDEEDVVKEDQKVRVLQLQPKRPSQGGRGEGRLYPLARGALSARVGISRIEATRLPICYRNHHLHRPDIDIADMDDVRKSLSKLKKDFKHRLGGKKRGEESPGGSAAGERASSPAPLLPPGPRVEYGRISTGVSQAHSTDSPLHLEPVTADEGSLDDPQRKGVDVDEKGINRSRSSLDPDVRGVVGSGPGREIKPVASPLSVTPITPEQEPDSA
jgi:hypothetical protein